MQTVREQLVEALERALTTTQEIERVTHQRHFNPGTLQKMADALDRHRAEPEGCICDTCPVCAVSVRDCQCYQEGIEAQRERVGGGRA